MSVNKRTSVLVLVRVLVRVLVKVLVLVRVRVRDCAAGAGRSPDMGITGRLT